MSDEMETIRQNRELRQKYHKIEKEISGYQNTKDLFEGLITHMDREFGIPYLWITVTDRKELSDMIGLLETSEILKDRLKILSEPQFLELCGDSTSPILVNADMKPYYKLLPRNVKYFIRSLAVAPFRIHDQPSGSINCGDASILRYQPGMDTALLDELAIKVSERLSLMVVFEGDTMPASDDIQETHKG